MWRSRPRAAMWNWLKTLPNESDESLNRIQGGRLATALHAYLSDSARAELAPRVEEMISHRMLTAPTLGLRIVNFRTFTGIAQSPDALHQIKDLLAGNLSIPELTLRPLDRWNLIGHLIEMGDPEAGDSLKYEQAHDHSGEALKYAYAVQAGAPDAAVKARYFDDYLHKAGLQEDWITQSLRPFNSWNQTALTAQYLAPALDELPNVKAHRKIFFLGAWLNAFIDGQTSPEAQKVVQAWLAKPDVDPDLRLKVLEVSDGLDRTVRIRQKFPE
jgi:aminopeptidase N